MLKKIALEMLEEAGLIIIPRIGFKQKVLAYRREYTLGVWERKHADHSDNIIVTPCFLSLV